MEYEQSSGPGLLNVCVGSIHSSLMMLNTCFLSSVCMIYKICLPIFTDPNISCVPVSLPEVGE